MFFCRLGAIVSLALALGATCPTAPASASAHAEATACFNACEQQREREIEKCLKRTELRHRTECYRRANRRNGRCVEDCEKSEKK
jgi:hypothetical protein